MKNTVTETDLQELSARLTHVFSFEAFKTLKVDLCVNLFAQTNEAATYPVIHCTNETLLKRFNSHKHINFREITNYNTQHSLIDNGKLVSNAKGT